MLPRTPSITLLLLGIISFVAQPRLADGARWSPADDLTDARAYSPAVTLLDGRILVAGGTGRGGNPLASAEIFDSATGTWSATGNMLVRRTQHTATALADGRVLVVGGLDRFGNRIAECELYDPTTGIWTATTSYYVGVAHHPAVRFLDGRVFVVPDSGSPAIYDPATATWSFPGALAFGYQEQTLTLLADGRVIMVGGGNDGVAYNYVDIFDPAVNDWTGAPQRLIEARQGHTATLLPDGRLLVAGGQNGGVALDSAELYDPITNQWSRAGRLNAARAYHTATELANGDVVIAGGVSGNENINTAEIYHVATGKWARAGITPPVSHHAAALLPMAKSSPSEASAADSLPARKARRARQPANSKDMRKLSHLITAAGVHFAGILSLVAGLWLISFGQPASGADITLQVYFHGNPDGTYPHGGVIQARDGNYYGITHSGGVNWGTVFKIDPSGQLTTIYRFGEQPTDLGVLPWGRLVEAKDGNFYGTTWWTLDKNNGVIYKVSPLGVYTLLHIFRGNDGTQPVAGLTIGKDGKFYGVASTGGAGWGTVFKMGTNGRFTLLHQFNSSDGASPTTELVQGNDGNFYGTTDAGGDSSNGTIFRITPDGVFSLLHSFTGGTEGSGPDSALIQARDGDFYGVTNYGGSAGRGTIFRVTSGGTLTTLYEFQGAHGALPSDDPLLQASDGNFYGATTYGGATQHGTLYQLTRSGRFTTIYTFNGADGDHPLTTLIQDSTGQLAGVTYEGGGLNGAANGSFFRMTLP